MIDQVENTLGIGAPEIILAEKTIFSTSFPTPSRADRFFQGYKQIGKRKSLPKPAAGLLSIVKN